MVDSSEPNDEASDAITLGLGDTAAGIIAPDADLDYYFFRIEDYYDVTASLSGETFPGEIQITSSIDPTSGPIISANSLAPGRYRMHVEQAGLVVQPPFNCYSIELTGTPSYMAPDVFDDEDPSTPAPGGWPTPRNDALADRTLLEIDVPYIGMGGSVYYDDLNLDRNDDVERGLPKSAACLHA